jgi:hypothetical protein
MRAGCRSKVILSLFGPDVNFSIEVQAYGDGAGKEYTEGEVGSTYADAQPGSVVLKQGSWLQVVMLGDVPETPGFGSTHLLYDLNTDGAALVDGNSDLHARLALKLEANPALRLILCSPKLTGYRSTSAATSGTNSRTASTAWSGSSPRIRSPPFTP